MTDPASSRFFRIGDIVVDRERNCLLRDGAAIKLEPRVTELLVYLAQSGGRVVSRDELMREVWKTHVVDDAVHRAMSLLRSALGDDSKSPRLVETVPGKGYRLLSPMAALNEPIVVQRPSRRLVAVAMAGAAVGALLCLVIMTAGRDQPVYAPEAPTPTPSAQPAAPAWAPEAPRA